MNKDSEIRSQKFQRCQSQLNPNHHSRQLVERKVERKATVKTGRFAVRPLNEDASVGAVEYFGLLILFFAFFYIMIGGILDSWYDQQNDQISNPRMVVSHERLDTMALLQKYWIALPIIILIGAGYFAIKTALREKSGEVF